MAKDSIIVVSQVQNALSEENKLGASGKLI
jgi:hypothetical protein